MRAISIIINPARGNPAGRRPPLPAESWSFHHTRACDGGDRGELWRSLRWSKLIATIAIGMLAAAPGWSDVPLFSIDAASYKMPGDWAFLEVYTLTPRRNLLYEKVNEGTDSVAFQASIELVCTILSGNDTLASDTLDAVDMTPDTALITDTQNLPYIFTFQIRAGSYKLKCQMIDRKRAIGDITENALIIPDYPDDDLAMSDIELAISVDRKEQKSKFCKNGYLIYPNPQSIYGESLPRLGYYAELYNLNFKEGTHGVYSVEVDVLDAAQKPFRSYERKVRPIAGAAVVDVGGFPVTTYQSGTYFLKLTLTDSTTGEKTSRLKKFFVLNPSEIAQQTASDLSGFAFGSIPTDYASLNEDEVNAALADITYIVTPDQERQLKKLNLEGKRQFLDRFWAARDTDPSTSENESRTEHYRRLAEARQLFGYLDISGWQTDRGRIWILYGRPDSEDSHPMEIDARAYRIWYYDQVEGGVEFIFVDHAGFGNFELVHSTKKGEIYNSNWYEMEVQGYRTRTGGRSLQPSSEDMYFWRD